MIARFCDHVSICILVENVTSVCRESILSAPLYGHQTTHLQFLITGLLDLETGGGQQLDDITIRVTERTYIVVIPRATLNI